MDRGVGLLSLAGLRWVVKQSMRISAIVRPVNEPEISAETVKQLRIERGWTQDELAAIAGLSSQAIVSNIERGLRPGAEVERRLREVLIPAQDTVPAMTREGVAADA